MDWIISLIHGWRHRLAGKPVMKDRRPNGFLATCWWACGSMLAIDRRTAGHCARSILSFVVAVAGAVLLILSCASLAYSGDT